MDTLAALPLATARRSGSLVFVSGQLALQDGQVVGNDVASQTDCVVDAIERQLAAFGIGLDAVVKIGVWLVSSEDFPAFNNAYAARFTAPYPARSTVISELAIPGALVEIDAIAQIDDQI